MGVHFYWISALTYAVIIGMILLSNLRVRKISGNIENSFKQMTIWVMLFCLQDTVWGLCDAGIINNDSIFFRVCEIISVN